MKARRKIGAPFDINTVAVGYAALRQKQLQVGEKKAKVLAAKRRDPEIQRERDAIEERLNSKLAASIVEESNAADIGVEEELAALAALDRERNALPHAQNLQQLGADEAVRQFDAEQSVFAATVLPFVRNAQDEALSEIRRHVAALCEPLAELLAHETIATTLLGHAVKIPRGAPVPLGGTKLLQSLVFGMPAMFCPDALSTAAVGAIAAQRRQDILMAITTEK